MKNFIALIVATIATALAFAVPASAATYVGVGVGASVASVETLSLDDGYALDLTVGTDVNVVGVPLRVEGAVARINQDTNLLGLPVGVEAIQLSASAFYDFDIGSAVTPYVGAGVTYTQAQADVLFTEVNASGFGWTAGAGFRTPISDRVTADVGVRYGQSEVDADFFGPVDVESTQLRVGFSVAL